MHSIGEWWMWAGLTGFMLVMSRYRIHGFCVAGWYGIRKNEMYDARAWQQPVPPDTHHWTIPSVTADPGFAP